MDKKNFCRCNPLLGDSEGHYNRYNKRAAEELSAAASLQPCHFRDAL